MCIDPFNLLQHLPINISPYIFWIYCHPHWHIFIVSFIPLICYNIYLLIAHPIFFGLQSSPLAHVIILFIPLICYNIYLLIACLVFLNLLSRPFIVSFLSLICYNICLLIARPIFFWICSHVHWHISSFYLYL